MLLTAPLWAQVQSTTDLSLALSEAGHTLPPSAEMAAILEAVRPFMENSAFVFKSCPPSCGHLEVRDVTCPLSTRGGTRRVRLVGSLLTDSCGSRHSVSSVSMKEVSQPPLFPTERV